MQQIDYTNIGSLFKFHASERQSRVLVDKARSGRSRFFLNDEETAYLCYDGIFGGKWAGHVHGMDQARGKELWKFAHETAVWMVKNSKMTELICFVKSDNKSLRLFVKQFKMPLVGAFNGSNIYMVDDKQILEFGR